MRRQLKRMGAMFDWEHEAISADPKYYKWNQWFFLKMYERGLAYRKNARQTGARRTRPYSPTNRSSTASANAAAPPSYRKTWSGIKIRDYADELLEYKGGLADPIITMQRNWIGRRGFEVDFGLDIPGVDQKVIRVFTTRPDTIFGATFMVLAPEHPLVAQVTTPDHKAEVEAYAEQASRQNRDRADEHRARENRRLHRRLVGQQQRRSPIWTADYARVCTGQAPSWAFLRTTSETSSSRRSTGTRFPSLSRRRTGMARPSRSGPGNEDGLFRFNGLPNEERQARNHRICRRAGGASVPSRICLRDWLISRQRYWGIYPHDLLPHRRLHRAGEQLPVVLPEDAEFSPTGESPLAKHEGFVKSTSPRAALL